MLRALTLTLAMFSPLAGACTVDGRTTRHAETAGSVGAAEVAAGMSPSASASCVLDELEREYLRLPDGDFVYVEPQHFERHGDVWVLAGQAYPWSSF